MSGPSVHQASAEQAQTLLTRQGIQTLPINPVTIMEPDFNAHHAYDFLKNWDDIIWRIEQEHDNIRKSYLSVAKNFSRLNKVSFNRSCRFIMHYCEDAHAIGQISSEFWGSIDNRIDLRTEITSNKKAYRVNILSYTNKTQARAAILSSMRSVYNQYRSKAKSYWFLIWPDVDNMARNAVKCGAEFAAAYIKMALL